MTMAGLRSIDPALFLEEHLSQASSSLHQHVALC